MHLLRVASELENMSVYPFKGKALVEQAKIARVGGGGFGTEGDYIQIS